MLRRMVAALRWQLDDGVEDEADVKLVNLEARDDNPTTSDALEACGDLADEVHEELRTFEIFELSTIEEARGLAAQLRESAGPGPSSDAAKQAIELRDGLFVLLRRRMRIVRRAAEFVFQEQPEIVTALMHRFDWAHRKDASTAVAQYIEVFYNSQRLHSSTGYTSPSEFEAINSRPQSASAAA